MQADLDRKTDHRQAERPDRTQAEAEHEEPCQSAFWRRLRRGVDENGKSMTNKHSLSLRLNFNF